MLAFFGAAGGWLRALRDTRTTRHELDRLGITPGIMAARAAEIDAATPAFAQTRGKPWSEIGAASMAFLTLLRDLPDGAGPDALIAHLRAAGERRQRSR